METSNSEINWDKWKTEQIQTITQILSQVFKVEDEARQIIEPSRLVRRSSIKSPEEEAELREKLTQIRQQISEYEEVLKLGLQRVDNALAKINRIPLVASLSSTSKKTRPFLQLLKTLKILFTSKS